MIWCGVLLLRRPHSFSMTGFDIFIAIVTGILGVIVASVLVGGTEGAWTIFGRSFNEETRSGTVNLVIGMVLGGIVGIWFGTSYGSMRKTELAAQAAK